MHILRFIAIVQCSVQAALMVQCCLACRYVGLKNLGNSCYMNSVLQVLWTLPQLKERYASRAESIFNSAPEDPTSDFATQVQHLNTFLDPLKQRHLTGHGCCYQLVIINGTLTGLCISLVRCICKSGMIWPMTRQNTPLCFLRQNDACIIGYVERYI